MIAHLKKIATGVRAYQEFLYRHTPLMAGREVRKIARLLKYDIDLAEQLAGGAVAFEPRHSYPIRAIEWIDERRRVETSNG